ncbi:hypothetical protein AB0K57_30020, partial [Streptomyces halstedii]|uniref:hypothetical protein n=1 Tax=Streptomyces halstedii TaxID=1944 RepID=UPI0034616DF5
LIIGTVFFRRKSVQAYELARERIGVVNADPFAEDSAGGLARRVQPCAGSVVRRHLLTSKPCSVP